jgi:folate-binding protein YgfZ
MINDQTVLTNDYTALTSAMAVQLRADAGVLVLTDADRRDFLHRMTTNQINDLKPGQSAVTVLTSPTARILFVFTVVCRTDDLLLLPTPGEAAALAKHLRGQIFFMDKVQVREESAAWSRMRLMGPQAGATLAKLGFTLQGAEEGAWQEQAATIAVKQLAYDLPGYELITPTAQDAAVRKALALNSVHQLENDVAYHAQRIALGRPVPGYELTNEYNPLEAGLAWACADNKGCYTGQEIIARQITYDKVTKHLVGLSSATLLTPGALLQAEGREAGVVTSVAYSPTLAKPIALAIVKRAYAAPGQPLSTDGLPAEVVDLPFVR